MVTLFRDSTEDYWHMSWGPEDKSLAEYVSGTSSSSKLRHEVAPNNSFKEQNQPLPKVPTEAAGTALIPGTERANAFAGTGYNSNNEQVVSVDVHAAASTRM